MVKNSIIEMRLVILYRIPIIIEVCIYEVELLELFMPNSIDEWLTLFMTTYKTHNSW